MSTASATKNPWSSAFRGRSVLVTGHTGFKGGWLALWLSRLGARVTGYALPPVNRVNLFDVADIRQHVQHIEGDIRDLSQLDRAWTRSDPDVVFHLAAQPLVRESYKDPLTTISTNTLGTVHVMELARKSPKRTAVVSITSDKCYENLEIERGYAESDLLGGRDVYSGSKAAAEILINSYRRSFFADRHSIATGRAGNVIGGGDWSPDRIVPDAIRALTAGNEVLVRSPRSVRPWQHVLEPLSGYLTLATLLLGDSLDAHKMAADCWNFGPTPDNTRTVGELVTALCEAWGAGAWRDCSSPDDPHEAGLLRLDITKAQQRLAWRPRLDFEDAIRMTADWYKAHAAGENMFEVCQDQIIQYEASA